MLYEVITGNTNAKVSVTGIASDSDNFAKDIDNVSAVNVTVTVGIANLNSAQYARFTGAGTVSAGVIEVVSYQNYDTSTDDYNALTEINSGGGALISVTGYIGISKANASGIASFGGGIVGMSPAGVLPVIVITSYSIHYTKLYE